jgi:glycosyltransferase involved in cell wall biosynthesis
MRVLYFTRDYTPHDHRFLSALAENGQQVYYLRLERRGAQLEDRPLPASVEQITWRGGRRPARPADGPALVADLKRVIARVRPDVIHAGPIQSSAFLAALAGFHPLVSMSWGSDLLKDAERGYLWRRATAYTLKRTSVLVGDCQAVRHKAEALGFPAGRIVTFPWGVDLERFHPGANMEWRARRAWEQAFVILSLRAWEPLYGVDVVARAFGLAAQERPELRLALPGSGSQAGLIRQTLERYQALDKVFFGGQVSQDDLPGVYRAADLYVSASHSDGSSVSLMEALASGLPALVSDIPGNREWIAPEGGAGWLFADGDANALAAGMLRAVETKDQHKKMSLVARALAEERADWKKNFARLLEAYDLAVKIES